MTSILTARILNGFDDPAADPDAWRALLSSGSHDCVFATRAWHLAWWQTFGRGKLLLVLAEQDGQPVALAPLYADSGMIYLIGSGQSDYLDFIGSVDAATLQMMLATAIEQVDDFTGCVFYHLLDDSPTVAALAAIADSLNCVLVEEESQLAPAMDLISQPELAIAATQKKSLVRHEKLLARQGEVQVRHWARGSEIAPQLDNLFAQHIARWAATPFPSLFLQENNKQFYRRLTETAHDEGWLRFTRVDCAGHTVAIHFGFSYQGSYFWYKPTFDPQFSRFSPGEVLLRHLLLAAIGENSNTFDFGLGDESFKSRFATHKRTVRNWGLYSRQAIDRKGKVS